MINPWVVMSLFGIILLIIGIFQANLVYEKAILVCVALGTYYCFSEVNKTRVKIR